MKNKFLKSLSMSLILVITGATVSTQADELETKTKKVQVEVIFDNNKDADFAKNIVFDDETKLSDYEYSVANSLDSIKLMRSYALEQYFNYAAWITRDGVVSLSLDPKDNVRTDKNVRNAAWDYISSNTAGFASSPNWNNTQVMQWQYECHYWFATHKQYWNLEPHRTAASYLAVVAKKCNP